MAEEQNFTPNGWDNENFRSASTNSASACENGLIEDVFQASTSSNLKIYPSVENVCETLFSYRLKRFLGYEELQYNIRKVNDASEDDRRETQEITVELQDVVNELETRKRNRAIVMDKIRAVKESRLLAEKRVSYQRRLAETYDEDAKSLFTWFPEMGTVVSGYRKEKERLASKHDAEKDALMKSVETERQRRQEMSGEKDRIKNQQKDRVQKRTEYGNIRQDDFRQKFDHSTASNQGDGQELSMLEEKLKKVQRGNVQRFTENQTAYLKAGQDVLALDTSIKDSRTADDFGKDADLKEEIKKIQESSDLIIKENINFKKTQEEMTEEEKALAEVRDLLEKECLKGNIVINELQRDLSVREIYSKQLDDMETEYLADRVPDQGELNGENLEARLEKAKEDNATFKEESDVIESLVEFTADMVDQDVKVLEEYEKELNETPCLDTPEKTDLENMKKMKEQLNRQLLEKRLRIKQIEGNINGLQNTIKSMLEEDLKNMHKKHTEISTVNFSYQEEFKKVVAAKADLEESLLANEEQIRVKEYNLKNLEIEFSEAEKEEQEIIKNIEEYERRVVNLTEHISEANARKDSLQETSESVAQLEDLFADKKSTLSQLQESQNEAKRRSDEKKTKLKETQTKSKEQRNLLDEEKSKLKEEMKCLEAEIAEQNKSKGNLKIEHEQTLFRYDTISLSYNQTKASSLDVKRNKIKLLNDNDLAEKNASETEAKDNEKIKTARAELDRFSKKYPAIIKAQDEKITSLKRQLAAFNSRISEIGMNRKIQKENMAAGRPVVKPILKSPAISDSPGSERFRKSVTFGDSPDNLHIINSDSSFNDATKETTVAKSRKDVLVKENTPAKKRKLFPLLGPEIELSGKFPKLSARSRTGSQLAGSNK